MDRTLLVMLAWAVLATGPTQAQTGGASSPVAERYDPKSETRVTGTIQEVRNIRGKRGGVHVVLKTATETLDVHLAPASFLKNKAFRAARGDALEVLGSRITADGKPALVAREIKKGESTLTLRDAQGVPAWTGKPKP